MDKICREILKYTNHNKKPMRYERLLLAAANRIEELLNHVSNHNIVRPDNTKYLHVEITEGKDGNVILTALNLPNIRVSAPDLVGGTKSIADLASNVIIACQQAKMVVPWLEPWEYTVSIHANTTWIYLDKPTIYQ